MLSQKKKVFSRLLKLFTLFRNYRGVFMYVLRFALSCFCFCFRMSESSTYSTSSTILLSMTPDISEFLKSKMRLKEEAQRETVDLDELCHNVAKFNSENPKLASVDLKDLLENSKIVKRIINTTPTSDNGSNSSSFDGLRKIAEERKYQKSISSFLRNRKDSYREDIKSMGDATSFASHFVLAFASAFLAGYYLGEYAFDTSQVTKYILGGAMSFLVLIVESLLFIIREEKGAKSNKKGKGLM